MKYRNLLQKHAPDILTIYFHRSAREKGALILAKKELIS
jgi:hypothetical protein